MPSDEFLQWYLTPSEEEMRHIEQQFVLAQLACAWSGEGAKPGKLIEDSQKITDQFRQHANQAAKHLEIR